MTDRASLGQLLGLLRTRGDPLPLLLTLQLTRRLLGLLLGALRLVQELLLFLLGLVLLHLHYHVVQVDILWLKHLIALEILYYIVHPQQTEQSEKLESLVLLGEITPDKRK